MRFPRLKRYLVLIGCAFWLSLTYGTATAGSEDDPVPTTYRYTPDGWPAALEADLYLPRDVRHPPVVLVIHGGGWGSGKRTDGYVRLICRQLVDSGFAAVSVDYRLAPAWRYPAQMDDMAEAVRWLRQEGPGLGLDTRRLGVWGYSAGAHMASLMSTEPQALPIAAVVAGGTPADLRVWPDSPMVRDFLGKTREQAPDLWANASPVTRVNAQTPPHFLYHGRLDRLVAFDQARRLEAALKHVDVPVTVVSRWFYGHILAAIWPGRSYDQAIEFLKETLSDGQPEQAASVVDMLPASAH